MSVAFIQGNSTTGGSGLTSLTTAFSSNNTAGSLLVCVARLSGSGTISIGDNNSNTWHPVGTVFNDGGSYYWVWYALNANSGANTVKVTITGGSGYIRMAIGEWGPGVTALSQHSAWYYAGGATAFAPGVNDSNTNILCLMCGGTDTISQSISSVGGGFSNRVENSGTGDVTLSDFVGGPTSSSGPGYIVWPASCSTAISTVSFTTSSSVSQNLWQKQGSSFNRTLADYNAGADPVGLQGPNVIYEGNPQILTSYTNVYKMWFMTGPNIGYAESATGLPGSWTRYGSNVMSNTIFYPRVMKQGSTYYMSGPNGNTGTQILIYSSTNGLSWSAVSQTTAITNDSGYTMTHGFLWFEGSTWYCIYDEFSGGPTNYQICLATSTDASTWTKYGSNPIIAANPNYNPSGPFVQKVGSTYYLWAESWLNAGSVGGTSDIYRWHASSLQGPWTLDGCTFPRVEADEGPDSIGYNGGITDVCMVQVGSTTQMWYTANPFASTLTVNNSIIKSAIANGTALSSVVASLEGTVVDSIATPSSATANYVQSANYASTSASGPNSPALAFTSNNTAGNVLILVAKLNDGTNSDCKVTSVSDTAGNTWTYGCTVGQASGSKDEYILYYVSSCLAGANSVKINTSDATTINWDFIIAEYTGFGTSPALVTASFASAKASISGTSGLQGNLHLTSPGVLIAFFGNPSTNSLTFTPGTGWTNRNNANGNLVLLDSVAGSSGVYQATTGLSSSVAWEGLIAAFGPLPIVAVGAYIAPPIPVTLSNASGHGLAITSPTTTSHAAQPIPVVFTDINGNEYSVTGATTGSEIASPYPVILCNPNGQPIIPPVVITSNGNSVTITSTLTGNKLGQPTPVVLTNASGDAIGLSGFTTGTFVGNPTPCALTDINGNPISLTLAT